MAGSQEGPRFQRQGDLNVPWQIPQHFTDAQILEHLKGIPRLYSTDLDLIHPDLLDVSDALLLRFVGEDLILEFKEMRRIGSHTVAMRVGRPRDLFIITSHHGDISARFSRPVMDRGEFVTGRFNLSTKPEANADTFIGESYRLSDPRLDTVDGRDSLVLALESIRRIESVQRLPASVLDYDAFLAELARERRPKPH